MQIRHGVSFLRMRDFARRFAYLAISRADRDTTYVDAAHCIQTEYSVICLTIDSLPASGLTTLMQTQSPILSGMANEMSTGEGAVAVLCGWEGNRRSDVVAPAMRHRLCGISKCVLSGLRKGDEHSAYASLKGMVLFSFLGVIIVKKIHSLKRFIRTTVAISRN